MTAPEPGGGSLWTRRSVAGLPNWATAGLALAAVVIVVSMRRKTTTPAPGSGATTPDMIFQFYETHPSEPPAGGRTGPPGGPPTPVPPGGTPVPQPAPAPPGGGIGIPEGPIIGRPQPAPTPGRGQWVTVAKFANPAPWNSTLWGIAQKIQGSGSKWGQIWNDPTNASLRTRRGAPEKIQPGDRVWVSQ